jgi:hypothetical protein
VGHGEQLGRQGVQVDPLAQAGAEGGDRPGGVVAVPVEARSTAAWTRRRAGWKQVEKRIASTPGQASTRSTQR